MPRALDLPTLHGSASVLVEGAAALAVGDDTRYMVASVSKQFIAVAVLLAHAEGSLDLADGVRRQVPELGPAYGDVTVHHLLTHTSGVRHWTTEVPGLWISDPGSAADRIAVLAQNPPLFRPGSEWHYSSVGYALLVTVVERATDTAYADLFDRLARAADLTSTTVGRPASDVPAATGARGRLPVPPEDHASTLGTGYVWSTADDLAKWTDRLHGGLLPHELHELLVTPHVPIPVDDPQTLAAAYGYGLIVDSLEGHRAWFHAGDNPGSCAFTGHLPDLSASIAFVSGEQETDAEALAAQLVTVAAYAAGG